MRGFGITLLFAVTVIPARDCCASGVDTLPLIPPVKLAKAGALAKAAAITTPVRAVFFARSALCVALAMELITSEDACCFIVSRPYIYMLCWTAYPIETYEL